MSALEPLFVHLGCDRPALWAVVLETACEECGITPGRRQAAFLATVIHESQGFRHLKENLNYSAQRLTQVWPNRFPTIAAATPFARNPAALAEKVYAGRMGNGPYGVGDGTRFIGRGLIQLTGRSNYESVARLCGKDVIDMPAWLEAPEGAATSAATWWISNGLNELADRGDITAVRRRVNGGTLGLAEVQALYRTILAG